MTRTRRRCSCLNLILLTPLCWLSLHLCFHFGFPARGPVHHSDSSDFREFGGGSPSLTAEGNNLKAGNGEGNGDEASGNGHRHFEKFGSVRRVDGRADNISEKWRQVKRAKSPLLAVGGKPRRNSHEYESAVDENTTNAFSAAKRPFKSRQRENLQMSATPGQRKGGQNSDAGGRPHGNVVLPFQPAGYTWRNDGPGEMGKPVTLAPADQQRADATFALNRFNLVVSDQIALNRTLPDVRPPRCRVLRYPGNLPSTSVIIVFHNEAWSALLRTVTSVIDRSPAELLHEVILVDDASDAACDWLQQPLEEYVAGLPVRVRLERLGTRQGIVAARHRGVAVSSGEVLTFLDSHCECTVGWLEPLLQRISRDGTRVVSPVIDSISDVTFEYSAPSGMPLVGGFSWLPEFLWTEVPVREQRRVRYDIHLPLRTPTIAGGLLSVHRDFFLRLGGYDAGMRIWGGENLQLSFKVWQCGGSLEIVPCSHVGHIFRSTTPYDFPQGAQDTILRNNRRLLEVWADAYTRELFYAVTPAYRAVDYGDVTGETALKHRLGCRDFRWYLGAVYPEHNLPLVFQVLGAIKNLGVNMCLDDIASRADGKRSQDTNAALDLCHGNGPGQVFAFNTLNQLQHDRQCLTAVVGATTARLRFCVGAERANANQRWTYNNKAMTLVNQGTHRCLDVIPSEKDDGLFLATTNECNSALSQQWTMHNITVRGFS